MQSSRQETSDSDDNDEEDSEEFPVVGQRSLAEANAVAHGDATSAGDDDAGAQVEAPGGGRS